MQAIILAAGMGKRLGELTKRNTKCMVEVGGVRLIERALRILDRKQLSKIIMVVGYQHENLVQFVETLGIKTPIQFIINEVYDKTNNIVSLSMAKEYLMQEDTLLLESDLIFEERLIDLLLEDERDTLALVDKFENWMDGTCIVVDKEDNITDFIPGKLLRYSEKERYYKTVNIYKFGAQFSRQIYVPFLEAYAKAMGNNEYYESVMKLILMLDCNTMKAKKLTGELWYEIDDIQDLDIAETIFIEDDVERYEHLISRYGGYWRFPHLLDYCYTVNPYFPTRHMVEEMESNFEVLMRQYPSDMEVDSLLAVKKFGVRKEHILIGNGSAELIKVLSEQLHGKVGIIKPTFEEHLLCCKDGYVEYNCELDDFKYDADKLIKYFTENPIENLVLIEPENVTGYRMENSEIKKVLTWCREEKITVIMDESFSDFADDESGSMLSEEVLKQFENLFVVKSISKSYGVPGLRIGVLAGSDAGMISTLKKKTSIWNLNSMAEFFMQILDKYKADYARSLVQIKEERKRFYGKLQCMEGLKVYPSSANYFMCELVNGMQSNVLAGKLLRENILIKDLTGKIGNGRQYIRIAIRNSEENDQLLEVLKKIWENRENE